MRNKTSIVTSAADGCGQPSSIRTMDHLPSHDHNGAEYKESFMFSNRSSVSRGCSLAVKAAIAGAVLAATLVFIAPVKASLINVELGWAGNGPATQSGTGPTPAQSGHNVPNGTVAAAPSTGSNNWDYLATDSSYYPSTNYTAPLTLSAADDSNGNATNISFTYTNTPLASYPDPNPWIERTAGGAAIVPGAMAFISFPTATWNTNNGTDDSSPNNPLSATVEFSGLNPGGTYDLYIYSAYVDGNTATGANTPTVSLILTKGTAATTSYTYTYNMSDTNLLASYQLGTNYEEFSNVTPDASGNIQVEGTAVNSSLFNGVQLYAVPEPATLGLFAVGAAGLLLLLKRRKTV